MRFLTTRRLVVASQIVAAASLIPRAATGQPAEAPEPFLLLEVSRDCADEERDELLADALELRMPAAFIVRGTIQGVDPTWHVTWFPTGPETCELTFASNGTRSSMSLSPDASVDEVHLAASRVAWLASVSPEDDPGTPDGSDDEQSVDVPPPPPTESEPTPEPIEEPRGPEEPEPTEPQQPAEQAEEPEEQPRSAEKTEEDTSHTVIAARLSLLPGVAFPSGPKPDRTVPRMSLNMIGGSNFALDGYEFGTLFNHEREFMRGGQMALGANLVAGDVDGVQLALGLNRAGRSHSGVSAAVGANLVRNSNGALVAVGLNLAGERSTGVHVAGMNLANEHRGTQLGLVNGVRELEYGAQLGLLNAAGDVRGLQVSLLNVAREVEGAQLGLVNVAKSSDFSLGLLSIMWGEPLYFTAALAHTAGITLGLQHGSNLLRWSYLGGYEPYVDRPNWRAGLGLGLHIPLSALWLDVDAVIHMVVPRGEPAYRVSQLLEAKTSFGWQIAKRFGPYVGISGKALVTGLTDGSGLAPALAVEASDPTSPTRWYLWPELFLGVRF